MNRLYSLEINVTKECNFACSYCFEGAHCRDTGDISDRVDDIKKTVSTLFADEWFNDNFGLINLIFWGGEPTLRPDILKSFVDEYKDDDRVTFLMYSNGSRPDVILDIFEDVKDKFEVQISYDGQPIHDIRRKDIAGAPTSARAREAIKVLHEAGFATMVKSTIKTEDFKYFVEAWEDIKSLGEELGEYVGYSPTIEHKKDFDASDLVGFEKILKVWVKKEMEFYEEHGRFNLTWTDGNKTQCKLFQEGMFVDVDGGLYYCHGCPYEDECENLWFGDISDDNLTDVVKNHYKMFEPRHVDACEKCTASVCLNCNVVKYINSNKEEFIDRWYDFTSAPTLCDFYRLFGKYNEVLRRLLRRKQDGEM
jgi:sulfatase maturation enzyme AslB (radical SAM superfamily)